MARLIVLGMLLLAIYPLAGDPKTWKFFAPREEGKKAEEQKAEAPKAIAQKQAEEHVVAELEEPGPTDLDPEEQRAIAEEFQAVSDRTLGMKLEEMFAYWRVFGWTKSQSFAEMSRRAKSRERDITFSEFMLAPDENRGALVTRTLNVRRVLELEATANAHGIDKVYELWGWAEDTKGWLYCVLTAELPAGMPTGASIEETVVVTGYFFKLQGYLAAGAGPRDRPLVAPLLIGRINWKPSALAAERAQYSDWALLSKFGEYLGHQRFLMLAGIVIIFIVLRILLPRMLGGSKRTRIGRRPARRTGAGWLEDDEDRGKLANWLNDAHAGKLSERSDPQIVDAEVGQQQANLKPPIESNGHSPYRFGHGQNFTNN